MNNSLTIIIKLVTKLFVIFVTSVIYILDWFTRQNDKKMGHCISAVILKGNFDPEISRFHDLLGIKLGFDLTMFPISHYYTACWAKIIGVSEQLPGIKPKNLIFPCDLVIAHLMSKISHQAQPLYAIIETDYFGGIGGQYALVYQGNCLVSEDITQINPALAFLGVKNQDGMDEFDTVGLVNYRAMPEYLDKYIDIADQLGV